METRFSYHYYHIDSQLLLQEGPVYHPCTASYLPLDSVFVSRTKKLPKT